MEAELREAAARGAAGCVKDERMPVAVAVDGGREFDARTVVAVSWLARLARVAGAAGPGKMMAVGFVSLVWSRSASWRRGDNCDAGRDAGPGFSCETGRGEAGAGAGIVPDFICGVGRAGPGLSCCSGFEAGFTCGLAGFSCGLAGFSCGLAGFSCGLAGFSCGLADFSCGLDGAAAGCGGICGEAAALAGICGLAAGIRGLAWPGACCWARAPEACAFCHSRFASSFEGAAAAAAALRSDADLRLPKTFSTKLVFRFILSSPTEVERALPVSAGFALPRRGDCLAEGSAAFFVEGSAEGSFPLTLRCPGVGAVGCFKALFRRSPKLAARLASFAGG